jgi:hypothetical protein
LFSTSSGAITGNWQRSQNGSITGIPQTLWVDTVVPGTDNSGATASVSYTIYVGAQGAFGQVFPNAVAVGSTTMVFPFRSPNNLNARLQDVGVANFGSVTPGSTVESGGVFWWAAGATSGTYDLKYRPITLDVSVLNTSSAITLGATTFTLESGIPITATLGIGTGAAGFSYNFNSSTLLVGYSVPSGGTSTTSKDIYLQQFNASGTATSPLVLAQSNVLDIESWGIASVVLPL